MKMHLAYAFVNRKGKVVLASVTTTYNATLRKWSYHRWGATGAQATIGPLTSNELKAGAKVERVAILRAETAIYARQVANALVNSHIIKKKNFDECRYCGCDVVMEPKHRAACPVPPANTIIEETTSYDRS
jgi:ABC-type branched-subunit amino acid transport system substrate-binding protein